jgi:hypothetical protein
MRTSKARSERSERRRVDGLCPAGTRRLFRIVLLTLALLAVPAAASAHPVHVRLGVGAHYWFVKSGLFDLTLAVDGIIVGPLYVGGRVGAAVRTEPTKATIPIDILIGVILADGLIYIEGTGGPWIAIDQNDVLRGHGALGFGFMRGLFWVGVEIGYLEPNAILGLRLGLRF